MERKHFGIVRVLYSSSAHDMTDPQPKFHASFIPKHVKNMMKYFTTFCTKHSILRMTQSYIVLFFVAAKNKAFHQFASFVKLADTSSRNLTAAFFPGILD